MNSVYDPEIIIFYSSQEKQFEQKHKNYQLLTGKTMNLLVVKSALRNNMILDKI